MFQRNRVVVTALGLSMALLLAVPSASPAAGFGKEPVLMAGFMEQLWSWVTALWPAGEPPETTAPWEKEGSAIDPMGQTQAVATPPGTSPQTNPGGTH